MKCSVANLAFQIAIYHFITSNNRNNVVPPVTLDSSSSNLYSDTAGVVLKEEQRNIAQFAPVIIN